MSKYVVFELERAFEPGIAVVVRGGDFYVVAESVGNRVSKHKTLEEARAVAEAIAAFKNLTIRSWSL